MLSTSFCGFLLTCRAAVECDIATMNSMMIFAVIALLLPILVIYNRRKKK